MLLAQAVETSAGALVQTGGTVALASVLAVAVQRLFSRMTVQNDKEIARLVAMLEAGDKRAERLEDQIRSQNSIIQERIIGALVESNAVQSRTLELMQKRDRANDGS